MILMMTVAAAHALLATMTDNAHALREACNEVTFIAGGLDGTVDAASMTAGAAEFRGLSRGLEVEAAHSLLLQLAVALEG